MNKLKNDLINGNRNIKLLTVNKYLLEVKKLTKNLTGGYFQSYVFLKDYDRVSKYLNSLTNSQKFNQLKAILVILQVNKGTIKKGYKKFHKKYQEDFINLTKEQREQKLTGKKSDREKNNWLEWDQIIQHVDVLYQIFYDKYYDKDGKIRKKLNQYNFGDLNDIQLLFILSLYTQIPPRRLEYAHCEYILFDMFDSLSQEDKDNNIFLVTIDKNNNFISFGKNKIKNKTEDNFKFTFNKRLNSIAFIYLNINYFLRGQAGDNSLLYNRFKKKMSTTSLSLYLSRYFKKIFDKLISICMLRKIYHTHHNSNIKEAIKKFKKTTEIMNHSQKTAIMYYCKD